MADYILTTRALTVGYNNVPLIRDISLTLPKGRILTLIGPNGSGKSTILKSISGQLAAISGSVLLDGTDIARISRGSLARQMSVLLTKRTRPEMMTCFDVAAMGRYPYTGRFGRLTPHDREVVLSALSRVHADDLADRDFLQISDGQRQRVLLARALCQEPDILVLDEPTSFLDIRHKVELLNILLEEARTRQLTILLSLHEIDLAEKISDLVLCVRGDTVWRYGPPQEIFRDDIIAQLYDLNPGSYLTRRGSVELTRPDGAPQVMVIGGGGWGIPHYRALARRRIPFAAGILYENDMEADLAHALAVSVISMPAFEPISAEICSDARQLLTRCGTALDAGTPIRPLNQANRDLLDFAAKSGIRIVRNPDELS